MQYREVTFTFPDGETDRDKLVIVLQSPYSFVRWCRTQVGVAPNAYHRVDACCIIEQYLKDVTGVITCVDAQYVNLFARGIRSIIAPTWIKHVVKYVDVEALQPTYNDVGNVLLSRLERGEIA